MFKLASVVLASSTGNANANGPGCRFARGGVVGNDLALSDQSALKIEIEVQLLKEALVEKSSIFLNYRF